MKKFNIDDLKNLAEVKPISQEQAETIKGGVLNGNANWEIKNLDKPSKTWGSSEVRKGLKRRKKLK